VADEFNQGQMTLAITISLLSETHLSGSRNDKNELFKKGRKRCSLKAPWPF
jgi:hypothetical protein